MTPPPSARTTLTDRIRAAAQPPRPESFHSPLHDERVVARVGVWLGAALVICFVTGIMSHYEQHPTWWLPLGPSPAWGYRVTQGAHIISGTLMLPLLLAKLYAAYPRLFTWPPVKDAIQALDRLSVAVLISSTVFQIVTGLMNTAQWYRWPFGFVTQHFVVSFLAIGSLLIHIGLKLPVIQRALKRPLADDVDPIAGRDETTDTVDDAPLRFGPDPEGRTRRGFLVAVAATTVGAGILTAGQTIYPLHRLALLAPRRPDIGPQGLPINRTAGEAKVTESAVDPGYRLELTGPAGTVSLSHDQLLAMPQHRESLPIACVEGWSAQADWEGVRMRDLVAMAGGDDDSRVQIESLEQQGNYAHTTLPANFAADERTLLAVRLNGEVLHIEHGYPARIIAPNRPGVLQTKWVAKLNVVAPS